MRILVIAMLLISAFLSFDAAAQSVTKETVVATGDSYTRRTPCPTFDYRHCDATHQIHHWGSYATYINSATMYQVMTSDNSGRGGETCTTQAAWSDGIWAGFPRGLVTQVYNRITYRTATVASIMIGINDVNVYGVNQTALTACLRSIYDSITNMKVVAMTYPPIGTASTVWGIGGSAADWNRINIVNPAIRAAVAGHNAAYPANQVRLVELETLWPNPTSWTDPLTDDTVDGAHPSPLGALKIAQKWWQDACGSTPYFGFIANCNP